jgi:dihydroneopterin aldolase
MNIDALRQPLAGQADTARDAAWSGERLSVRVRGLLLEAEVGVYEHEYGRTQPLVIDLEAEVDPVAVRPHADLAQAVNYAALAETVREITLARHYDLLEDLVEAIAGRIFTDPRIKRLKLDIDKPAALDDADCVGVSFERWR